MCIKTVIMKVLKRYKDTGKIEMVNYPRKDLGILIGLDENIEYYGIVENKRPNYEPNTHRLKLVEVLSDDAYEGKSHIKTFTKSYELEQLPNEIIIENLSNSVGEHIESNYPNWKQNKHSLELQIGTTQERIEYITSLFNWSKRCRTERDLKQSELLNKNILPTFDWELIP